MAWSCWKQQSVFSKSMSVLTGILVVVIIGGIAVISWNLASKPNSTSSNNSESPINPIQTADEFSSFINPAVSPCDNFWEFSCGNANGRMNWTHWIETQVTREKIRLFADKSPPKEPKFLTQMKNFYKACIKQGNVTEINWEKIKKILHKLGDWPVIEGKSWNDTMSPWQGEPGFMASLVYSGFLNWRYDLSKDDEDSIDLDRMTEIAVTLGANPEQAKKELKEAFYIDDKNFTSASLKTFFKKIIFIPTNSTINRRISNFAFMHVISELSLLSSNSKKQEEKCFHFVSSRYPTAEKLIYVRKYYHENSTNELNKFMEKMKISLKNEFNKLTPDLDKITRQETLSKITNYSFLTNYPDEFFDDKKLENYYKNLVISTDDFLQGVLNYMEYKSKFFDVPEPIMDELNVELAEKLFWLQNHIPKLITHRSFIPIMGMGIIAELVKKYNGNCAVPTNPNDKCLLPYVIQNIQNLSYVEEDDGCQTEHWGLQGGYSLYNEWPNNHETEPPFADFANYTKEQMFWINYAHTKCDKIDKSSSKSADTLFILNVLRSKDFHRDFQCLDFSKKSNCTIN